MSWFPGVFEVLSQRIGKQKQREADVATVSHFREQIAALWYRWLNGELVANDALKMRDDIKAAIAAGDIDDESALAMFLPNGYRAEWVVLETYSVVDGTPNLYLQGEYVGAREVVHQSISYYKGEERELEREQIASTGETATFRVVLSTNLHDLLLRLSQLYAAHYPYSGSGFEDFFDGIYRDVLLQRPIAKIKVAKRKQRQAQDASEMHDAAIAEGDMILIADESGDKDNPVAVKVVSVNSDSSVIVKLEDGRDGTPAGEYLVSPEDIIGKVEPVDASGEEEKGDDEAMEKKSVIGALGWALSIPLNASIEGILQQYERRDLRGTEAAKQVAETVIDLLSENRSLVERRISTESADEIAAFIESLQFIIESIDDGSYDDKAAIREVDNVLSEIYDWGDHYRISLMGGGGNMRSMRAGFSKHQNIRLSLDFGAYRVRHVDDLLGFALRVRDKLQSRGIQARVSADEDDNLLLVTDSGITFESYLVRNAYSDGADAVHVITEVDGRYRPISYTRADDPHGWEDAAESVIGFLSRTAVGHKRRDSMRIMKCAGIMQNVIDWIWSLIRGLSDAVDALEEVVGSMTRSARRIRRRHAQTEATPEVAAQIKEFLQLKEEMARLEARKKDLQEDLRKAFEAAEGEMIRADGIVYKALQHNIPSPSYATAFKVALTKVNAQTRRVLQEILAQNTTYSDRFNLQPAKSIDDEKSKKAARRRVRAASPSQVVIEGGLRDGTVLDVVTSLNARGPLNPGIALRVAPMAFSDFPYYFGSRSDSPRWFPSIEAAAAAVQRYLDKYGNGGVVKVI